MENQQNAPAVSSPASPTSPQLPPFTVSPEYQAILQKLAEAASAGQPQPPKAGVLTTEFWLHVAALVIPAVLQVAGASQNVVVIAAAQAAAALYTLARTWIKAKSA